MAARVLSGLLRRLRANAQGHQADRAGEPSATLDHAESLWHADRQDEALHVIGAVTASPDADLSALKVHGRWSAMRGDLASSRALFERVIASAPGQVDGWLGLGNVARLEGRVMEAISCYERARALAPGDRLVLEVLVRTRQCAGDHLGAIAACRETVSRGGADAATWRVFAQALQAGGEAKDAEQAWEHALELEPDDAETVTRLAIHHCEQKAFGKARPLLEMAVTLPGAPPTAWANLAVVRRTEARFEEALAMSEYAAACGLALPEAQMERGMLLLALQRYAEGWEHYEARFGVAGLPSGERAACGTRWRGEPVQGCSIVIWAEQGSGDTFQFVRYARLLAAQGACVHIEAQPGAVRLLAASGLGVEVRPTGADWRDVAPAFHCAMMSLPYRFGTSFDTIPWPGPYLRAPSESRFERHFDGARGLRVGFVWAGNPAQPGDWARSVTWETVAPLAEIPGVVTVPLQMGEAGEHWRPAAGGASVDLRGQLRDFADTADLIARLDVVVTVCTSVAHLAGAMGCETFVLLAHAPDWRWLPGPDRTPWYPTATLFRCTGPGDWASAVARVAEALSFRARARAVKEDDGR